MDQERCSIAGEKQVGHRRTGKAHEHGFAADPVAMLDQSSGRGFLKDIEDGFEKSAGSGGLPLTDSACRSTDTVRSILSLHPRLCGAASPIRPHRG